MKKNTLMKTSAIVASAVMAAAANGATVSAKTASPRTMRRTKRNDVISMETIELSDAQAIAGKTVSVQMTMETGNNCYAYDLVVEYAPELELESVVGANAYSELDNYVAIVGYVSTNPFMDNKPIVTFNFKVPSEAEVGDIYEVKFNDIRSFSGLDCDFEYFELENSEIEVLEETKKHTDYMVFEKKDENGNVIDTLTGLRGDADGDGKVSAKDAAMIAQHCAKSYTGESVIESEENQYFANVNANGGKPTARDAAAIANYMAKKSISDATWDDVIK